MSYVVLARKYRPMSFDDLVGQDHVARTLSNAIAANRVAHAFLFTGVRGVGKTSSARILAKALNCMGSPGSVEPGTDPGPTVSPCLECPACLEITTGADVDVQEIDGASYNGVDEVRRLQDSLPYRPQRDRFKIVIVDEVHMLSQSAWNAFLKTLEEPPPHVKFIFATTEVHKVPITILSRVQRFDFKLIPTRLIVDRLRWVLDRERIAADEAALSVVGREAAGSMRDALSLLDQVVAWGGETLTGESVARVLGVASRQVLHDLAQALVGGDPAKCLSVVEQLASQGYDMAHVCRDFLALLRDLVVAKVCPDPKDLLDLPDEERADAMKLTATADVNDLIRLHQGFSQGFDDVVRSNQVRAAFEMLLVRLALRPPLLPLDELLTRIAALEKRLAVSSGSGGRGSPSTDGNAPAPPRSAPPRSNPASAQRPSLDPAASSPATPAHVPSSPPAVRQSASPSRPAPQPAPTPEPSASPLPNAAPAPLPSAAPTPSAAPAPLPSAAPAPLPSAAPTSSASPAPLPRPAPTPLPHPEASLPDPRPQSDPSTPAQQPTSSSASSAALPPDDWRSIINLVRGERPELAAFLGHAIPIQVDRERLRLGFEPDSMFSEPASGPEEQRVLLAAARRHFGATPQLDIERDFARNTNVETVAVVESRERAQARQVALDQARRHPLVVDAIQVLGARIKELHLPDA